jgi:putative NADH-flavin reductase
MRIAVIGATSRTGHYVLAKARGRGHAVTAFTRHPAEIATDLGLAASIQGDGTHLDEVGRAVRAQDAVISIIAAPNLQSPRAVSAVTRTVIEAMRVEGVRRLVITSSRSLGATRFGIGLVWAILHNVYADGVRSETLVEESGLDWTIVRAARLANGRGKGRYHADFEPDPTDGTLTIDRADYAEALLDAVESMSLIGKTVGVNGAGRNSPRQALALRAAESGRTQRATTLNSTQMPS